MFACRIKTRGNWYAFSQRNQLQIGAVVWLVSARSSYAMQWLRSTQRNSRTFRKQKHSEERVI